MKTEMSNGIALDGIIKTTSAPSTAPIKVRKTRSGKRRRSKVPVPRKGSVPPKLKKVKANILVATAVRGSIPNESMTGTVINELPPVTTPTTLVTKKITMRAITSTMCTRITNEHHDGNHSLSGSGREAVTTSSAALSRGSYTHLTTAQLDPNFSSVLCFA